MSSPETVSLNIDGKDVTVPKGTTIYNAAKSVGIDIPVLCHLPGLEPVAVCRICAVDVGARVYAAACLRQAEPGMKVKTNTEPVVQARKTLLELLMADHPVPCEKHKELGSCELELLAEKEGVAASKNRFAPPPAPRKLDHSAANIAVNHNACILCDRCIRACTNVKQNFVIGRNGKGYVAQIGFDNDMPMGQSSCVSCGECMVSCPTGALTNVGFEAHLAGEKVDIEWLSKLPIFQGISAAFLQRNEGAVVKRPFKKGEIICREGEFGNTAFYLLEGKVDIFISSPVQRATKKDTRSFFGIVRKMANRLTQAGRDTEDPERMKYIPIDATVDLHLGNPTAQLGPGDLFGEMSALSFYPRSATVRASEDCVLLEMLRPVLQILQKNPAFKKEMDLKYKDRALANQLRSMPIFGSLTPEFIDELRNKVELVKYDPGTVIFSEGDPADALYIVRIGFVKVLKLFPGGELTLAYLHRGTYFGEMGLMGEMVRTATCTALDHVEVVRIKAVDFNLMLEKFPQVRAEFEKEIRNRQEQTKAITQIGQTSDVTMRDFLDQGLMKAQSLLLLDLERCTRCDECVRACADAHDGITRLVRDGLRFDRFLVATACRSCTDPLCMVGCPVGSIRRRNSLEIIIEDWCVGCGLCAEQCPYGNINLHPFDTREDDPDHPGMKKAQVRNKATVCDLCTEHEEPSCVYACPHDAAHRVNAQEFFTRHYVGTPKTAAR
ncbi:MAG: cyclic nucleotide-binding domain-containing protein [Planctomycetes bacterium]|nr:cyclic nucleotide-binding domain-containing protein [Planctomycetota bacterium]